MTLFKTGIPLFILFCHNLSLLAQIPVMETGGQAMPKEWIDQDTGHKLKKLTDREGSSRSFYFHNEPFLKSADGKSDLMVFYGSTEEGSQLFTVDLSTGKIEQLTNHPEQKSGEILAKKHREVIYQIKDTVFATHVDTRQTRLVFVFPDDFKASITTLNADESKLAGTWAGPEKREIYEKHPTKGEYFDRIFEAEIPHTLFAIDLEAGTIDKIHTENTWLGHIQFSTTDPDILMFCHEGPWHKVDRIWNINIKTKEVRKIHERTVHREIAGHEFWSWDGKTIWYDLQIPRGETFYLAGYRPKSGKQIRYQMDRNEWSIHFNVSPDQKLFCGDGGDSTQVAKAPNGTWIYLFEPQKNQLTSQKLVNMQHHHYRKLEPNVHFSPDGKWIIFRANFEGESQIYAVEIKQSK